MNASSLAAMSVLLVLLGGAAGAQTVVLPLDPKATFLRVNSDAGALSSPALSLASLGLSAGGWCRIEQLGDWRRGPAFTDTSRGVIGVFSSSAVLLAGSNLARVPGAIGTGAALLTVPTYFGSLATDVPQDFQASATVAAGPFSTIVRVPPTAQFVFFAVPDSLYNDNSDPDADMVLLITPTVAPLLPGTSDDLEVSSGVNAPPTTGPGQDLKTAAGGATVTLSLTSPFSTLDGEPVVFGVQLVLSSAPVLPFYGVPELWVDPFSPAYIPILPNFSPLPTGATSFTTILPPGLAGLGVIAQGVALTPLARNGLYAAASAHVIVFL